MAVYLNPCASPFALSLSLQRPSTVLGDTALRMVAARCADVSVMVRKAAVATLSSLMEAEPLHLPFVSQWLTAVLPLVHDPEATVKVR